MRIATTFKRWRREANSKHRCDAARDTAVTFIALGGTRQGGREIDVRRTRKDHTMAATPLRFQTHITLALFCLTVSNHIHAQVGPNGEVDGLTAKFVDVNGVRTRYYDYGQGETIVLLHGGGLILGAFEHAAFEEETLQLDRGDILVVFSDGISERVLRTVSSSSPVGLQRIRPAFVTRPPLSSSTLWRFEERQLRPEWDRDLAPTSHQPDDMLRPAAEWRHVVLA
jgi:hypothetical protein